MKILLVCTGGMSTGLLMKKMEMYCEKEHQELEVSAVGTSGYKDVWQDYDIILIGPQVSYKLDEIKEQTTLPCGVIPSFDYAVANCANIMKLANELYDQRKPF